MEGVLTARTDKEQPVTRPVLFAGEPTARARLAGVGRLHLHAEGASQHRFVGKRALQLGKRPLGGVSIDPAGLGRPRSHRRSCAALRAAFGPLADAVQVFQADQS